MSLASTVISFGVMAVLVVVSVGLTWRLAAPGDTRLTASGGGVSTPKNPTDISTPDQLVTAAQTMVLTSHAQALVTELSTLARLGGVDQAAVAELLQRFPVNVEGVTIEASAPSFAVDRTIRLSDGTSTLCVVAPADGTPHLESC